MKDYTMSEIKEICKKYERCSECPFYKITGGISCTLTVDTPERWDLSKVEPNTVDERKAIIKGFVQLLKESIFAADPNKKRAIDGFLDEKAIFFLENTIDMAVEQIKLLIETNELVDYIRRDKENPND